MGVDHRLHRLHLAANITGHPGRQPLQRAVDGRATGHHRRVHRPVRALHRRGQRPWRLLSAKPFFNPDVSFATSMAGAAIAAYSFTGFDALSTLSEETATRAGHCRARSCWSH
ncbi:hypothetical protein P4234_17075 [Pseudomonas aeruginosa]|nr:hypothetical protein [Pseudomonas aeruginosa]